MNAAPSVDLSVIIPIRNRAGTRLENCLRSLRWQQTSGSLEILLSDFGSDAASRASIDELADRYGARVVRSATQAIWNRSRALNIGIRAAAGRFIFCTDADMLFAPNFIDSILKAQAEHGEEAMVLCRCSDLPETVEERLFEVAEFDGIRAQGVFRETVGTGACQAAPREFFLHARGYDEKYVFWGKEDLDMVERATRYGLTSTWIHEQTAMCHQWHATTKNDRRLLWHYNKIRFFFTKHRVVKNRRAWGELAP